MIFFFFFFLNNSVRHLPIPGAVEFAHPPLGLVHVPTENGLHRGAGRNGSLAESARRHLAETITSQLHPVSTSRVMIFDTSRKEAPNI